MKTSGTLNQFVSRLPCTQR